VGIEFIVSMHAIRKKEKNSVLDRWNID